MSRSAFFLPVAVLLSSCGGRANPPAPAAPEPVESTPLQREIEAALDRSVDPCTDFYAFACGGWQKTAEIPADKPATGRSFSVIDDRNQEVLHELLEGWASDPGEVQAHQQLGAYYASCMDTEAIDAAGVAPIQPVLDKIAAVKDRKGLQTVIAELQATGEDVFMSVWVGPDDKNPDLNILAFSQGGLGLGEKSYYEDAEQAELLAGYEAMLAKLFELSGATSEVAAERAAQAVKVEKALAAVSWKQEDLYDPEKTYNKLDRVGLQKSMPHFDLGLFLGVMGRPELTQINVNTPDYFVALDGVLHTGDLDEIKSYLTAWVLQSNAGELSSDFDQTTFAFFGTQMSGQKEQRVRWKRCVGATNELLGELLGQGFVDRSFAGDSKADALEMIEAIEAAFEGNLAQIAWMDDATRDRAVEKARAVRNKIGYPDSWKDYSSLSFTGVWFDNHTAALAHLIQTFVDRAEKPVDKAEWFMSPPTVNAYYNASGNEIVFPAGILQPPFYSRDYPKAMNFGAIGMVMGHELTHGFDDSGSKYDPTGKLTDWWDPGAVERFETAAACVKDQYSAFEVQPGLNLNGELTLGENIADMGGIKQAYAAYGAWTAAHGDESPVAGFNGDQLLFVAFAQGWCMKASPEYEKRLVAMDSHSPPRFRVNGPLANFPQFGEAFQCEVGSPMRPASTCAVW